MIITSYEPGEDWFYDFSTGFTSEGPRLADPQHHPLSQTVPGPTDRVPADWQQHIH